MADQPAGILFRPPPLPPAPPLRDPAAAAAGDRGGDGWNGRDGVWSDRIHSVRPPAVSSRHARRFAIKWSRPL